MNDNTNLVEWVKFQELGDDRGSLVAIEGNVTIPFDIKRIYYIFETKPDIARGFHAHRALKQVAICITGRCRMVLDNGKTRKSVWLESPKSGLLISDMIWREIHDFSDDCVLLVLASEHYNEEDYIRDYETFLKVTSV